MKKLASLLLALVLVFAMSSVAMAATTVTTVDDLRAALATDGDVKLGADISLYSSTGEHAPLYVSATVNLDLNGYTLTGPNYNMGGKAYYYTFIIEEGGTLTLTDTSEEQTGKIQCKYSGVETKGGTFIMDGGKIVSADAALCSAIVNYGGAVIINDGTVESYTTAITAMAYFAYTATVEINGGKIGLKDSEHNLNYAAFEVGGIYNNGETMVKINDGQINGDIIIDKYQADIEMTGGSFTDTTVWEVTGYDNDYNPIFAQEPLDAKDFIADGFKGTVDENGNLVVEEIIPPAPKRYEVGVVEAENGDVTVKGSASYDSGVVITAAPHYGYEVGTVTVTKADGTKLDVTERADGTYSFLLRPALSAAATICPFASSPKSSVLT